jgi:tetratricopeptide (TPR) repeat protein
VLAAPDPEHATRKSQRLLIITAALVMVFGLGLFLLWYSGSAPSSSAADSPSSATGGIAAAALEPDFQEWTGPRGGPSPALEKELEEARAVAAANPQDGAAMASLGRVQLQLGRGTDAVASFRSAADRDSQNWQHRFGLAQAECAMARWDECINALREAQGLAPDNWTVTYNLGVALHRRGVNDVAVAELGKAKELAPKEAAVHLGLAVSYDKLGRNAEAIAAYQEFLYLMPSSQLADRIHGRVSQLNSGK